MKNWASQYNFIFVLLFFVTSCTGVTDTKGGRASTLFIGTDETLDDIDFYSNDSFSQFIKDFIFEPICYYDEDTKQVKSSIISEFRWKSKRILEITIDQNNQFHNSNFISNRQSHSITSIDIKHSLEMFKMKSVYPSTKKLLSNITIALHSKDKNKLFISLNSNVDPNLFLFQLANLKIPIIPSEIKQIKTLDDFIGNGLYLISDVNEKFIYLSIFKKHPYYKTHKDQNLPEKYIIQLSLKETDLLTSFIDNKTDGIFIHDLSQITSYIENGNPLETQLFIRKEDEITFLASRDTIAINEKGYNKMDYIKSIINPNDYNNRIHNNNLITYYSNAELETDKSNQIPHLKIDLIHLDNTYTNYLLSNLYEQGITVKLNDNHSNFANYNLKSPSDNDKYISILSDEFYFTHFNKKPREINLLNQKILQKAKYLLFNNNVHFINERFQNSNDFSAIYLDSKIKAATP